MSRMARVRANTQFRESRMLPEGHLIIARHQLPRPRFILSAADGLGEGREGERGMEREGEGGREHKNCGHNLSC